MKLDFKKIFLENTGLKQTIFKNTFWLLIAEIITGLLRFVLLIYVTRALGATEYGKFTFAFSFVSIMVIFSDLGVIEIATREFSRSQDNARSAFSDIFTLDIILSAFALILMVMGSFLITLDPITQKLIWILAVFILATNFFSIFYALLRSRQKMEYEATIKVAQTVILVAVSLLFVYFSANALSLGWGYLLADMAALAFLLLFFHFYFQPLKLNWNKSIFNILKISWPLSLGFTGQWIYISLGSVTLGYFNFITENGWYNAASKIALISILPASLVIRSFYPALSNFFVVSKEKLQKSWDYLMQIMTFFVIPMLFGGVMLAPKIIDFLYGADFAPSVLTLQILMVAVAISFISFPYSVILVISDQQKKNFILIVAGIAINIILNFILIPVYSLYGAGFSVLISSAIVLFLTMIFSKHFVSISVFDVKLLKTMALSVFSAVVMLFAISLPLIYNLNVIFTIIIGAAVYFAVLFLLTYGQTWIKLKKI